MAAIERGSGADEQVVSGWLAKALSAPRGDAWICNSCRNIAGDWDPICENCDSFDTLEWQRAPVSEDARAVAASMLPLLVARPNGKDTSAMDEAADEDTTVDDTIIDIEVSDEPTETPPEGAGATDKAEELQRASS